MSKKGDKSQDISNEVSRAEFEDLKASLGELIDQKLSSLVSSLAQNQDKGGSSTGASRDSRAQPLPIPGKGHKEEEDVFVEEEGQIFVDPLAWYKFLEPGYESTPSIHLSLRPKIFPLRGDIVAENIAKSRQRAALQEYKSLACFGLYHACATKALEAILERIEALEVREECRAIFRTFQELEQHWRSRLQYVRAVRSGTEDPGLTKLYSEIFLTEDDIGGAPSVHREWNALKKSYLQKKTEQSLLQVAKGAAQASGGRQKNYGKKFNGKKKGRGKEAAEDKDAQVDSSQE